MQKLLFVVAATVIVAATPASAQWRDYGWDGPRVGSFGADAYADGRGYVVRRHHRGYVDSAPLAYMYNTCRFVRVRSIGPDGRPAQALVRRC
jgi:hypothetical protein